MNPVLLKPATDRRAFIVLRGQPGGTLEAGEYATGRGRLSAAAFEAYRELEETYDLVVAEGAGSPAEINLRAGDYVNFGLATEFGLPALLVGDIDRGGILASIYGHWAIVDDADRSLIAGYLINKFRGDQSRARPRARRTHRPDGPAVLRRTPLARPGLARQRGRARLRHVAPPSRARRHPAHRSRSGSPASPTPPTWTLSPPNPASTCSRPRARPTSRVRTSSCCRAAAPPSPTSTGCERLGLAEALRRRAAAGRPILGICGGYQMLAGLIDDPVESDRGTVPGLGLLPAQVRFSVDKVLGRPEGSWRGHPVVAYEIHHGIVDATDGEPFLDGIRVGNTWGTIWHGAFENDAFRRAWLEELASAVGFRAGSPQTGAPGFAERRSQMLDDLADALERARRPAGTAGTRAQPEVIPASITGAP